jgi:hypothetical protein
MPCGIIMNPGISFSQLKLLKCSRTLDLVPGWVEIVSGYTLTDLFNYSPWIIRFSGYLCPKKVYPFLALATSERRQKLKESPLG